LGDDDRSDTIGRYVAGWGIADAVGLGADWNRDRWSIEEPRGLSFSVPATPHDRDGAKQPYAQQGKGCRSGTGSECVPGTPTSLPTSMITSDSAVQYYQPLGKTRLTS
jgi:hypothetical protein